MTNLNNGNGLQNELLKIGKFMVITRLSPPKIEIKKFPKIIGPFKQGEKCNETDVFSLRVMTRHNCDVKKDTDQSNHTILKIS
jgi:hypothetical protein